MSIKNIKLLLYALLLSFAFTACASDDGTEDPGGKEANVNANVITGNISATITGGAASTITRLEFPKIKNDPTSLIIVHTALLNSNSGVSGINYCTEWDGTKKSQRWSCYEMYNTVAEQNVNRYESDSNQYPDDPAVPANYKLPGDAFWNSGYNHGHICPSADRVCSEEANIQTFYMSNMQPQLGDFNAGVWENMESQIRTWFKASPNDTLYICKGGTIDDPSLILTTTNKGLIVPAYFYMAILEKNSEGYKAIGFWVKHEANDDNDLAKYVVNIDDLQQKTGIDFFCNLPDNIENTVENLSVDKVKLAWGFK